jgi:hypothetical protein
MQEARKERKGLFKAKSFPLAGKQQAETKESEYCGCGGIWVDVDDDKIGKEKGQELKID